jgi:carboxypeptidase family protein/TonB-dependent receptor-like protein
VGTVSYAAPTSATVAHRCRRGLLAVMLLAVVAPHPPTLEAQIVRGQVINALSRQAVPQATVLLLRGERGDTVATHGVTDSQGHFSLEAATSGAYRLRCMTIGYQPATTPLFDLRAGDQPLEVVVRISPVAVLLAPLEIVSQRPALLADRWLMVDGYYDRAHTYGREGLGAGRFLDRDAIRQAGAFNVTDIVRGMPGVRVQGTGGARGIVTFRGVAGRCVPPVFVDGVPVTDGAAVNDVVKPLELAAMEVYPGITVPAEYANHGGQSCGAIVLWTGTTDRRPYRHADPPARELSLDLTLSPDSVLPRDSVLAFLVLANRSDTSRTVCITGSHLALVGAGSYRDIATKVARHPCDRPIELAPRASRIWWEVIPLAHQTPGEWLLQKRLDVRVSPCGDDPRCARSLKSNWHSLLVPAH